MAPLMPKGAVLIPENASGNVYWGQGGSLRPPLKGGKREKICVQPGYIGEQGVRFRNTLARMG